MNPVTDAIHHLTEHAGCLHQQTEKRHQWATQARNRYDRNTNLGQAQGFQYRTGQVHDTIKRLASHRDLLGEVVRSLTQARSTCVDAAGYATNDGDRVSYYAQADRLGNLIRRLTQEVGS